MRSGRRLWLFWWRFSSQASANWLCGQAVSAKGRFSGNWAFLAAETLGITRATLRKRIARYGISIQAVVRSENKE